MNKDRRRVKVRHLSTVHDIRDTRVTYKECAHLRQAGFDVALMSCVDESTELGGVPIIGIGRARNRPHRMLVKTVTMLRRALAERADVYHFHDPELIPVGLALKAFGKTVVYDVHEDVPKQILHKFWIKDAIKKPLAAATRFVEGVGARAFDLLVTATPSIAERFPAHKTIVCQNFPELDLASSRNETPFADRQNAFVYVGGLSRQQGLFEMLAAFEQLPETETGVLAGKFKQSQDEAMATPGWRHVRWPGVLTRPEVVEILRDGRVGLVLNHPITNYIDAYSTKMFEYMACGLPVICSNFPLWTKIVSESGCGEAVDPFDTDAVAAALNRYLDDPDLAARTGEAGRQAIMASYNWTAEVDKLIGAYDSLTD